jgi:plastocyanin
VIATAEVARENTIRRDRARERASAIAATHHVAPSSADAPRRTLPTSTRRALPRARRLQARADVMTRSLLQAAKLSWLSVVALCACSSSSTPTYTTPPPDSATDTTSDSSTTDSAADSADAAPDTSPMTHMVQVGAGGAFAFTPSTLTIKAGDTVMWSFATAGHTVTSGSTPGTPDNKFCSPSDTNCSTITTAAAGATYSHTFTTAGDYPYFCSVHFSLGMTGTITVTP